MTECQWFTCKKEAVIHVPRADSDLCEEHYLWNCVRFGCDLEGKIIENPQPPEPPE